MILYLTTTIYFCPWCYCTDKDHCNLNTVNLTGDNGKTERTKVLCEKLGYHSDEYKDDCLVGCYTV
jgi:hypothetical protein